ncbi:hypothetical protein GCM10028833_40000 [Glycomyces tarimensis]
MGPTLRLGAHSRSRRYADTSVGWSIRGHQFVTRSAASGSEHIHSPVDGHDVPLPHFKLTPTVRDFHTMSLLDATGNALEFKALAEDGQVSRSSPSDRVNPGRTGRTGGRPDRT